LGAILGLGEGSTTELAALLMSDFLQRVVGKGRRTLASRFRRRELVIDTPIPLISFSFDDAPRSAFDVGGRILRENGACATYYMSLGLLASHTEIGPIAGPEQLVRAVDVGHELGCHTFHHHDAWLTPRSAYVASIDENQRSLSELLPGYTFRTFAYPKSGAKLSVKASLEDRFECCRGGGQSINVGKVDRNLLSACFLDRHARVDLGFVRALIDRNAESRGWLIFAAHDISEESFAFSCSTRFFETVVRHARGSGAEILPVAAACSRLLATQTVSSI
jgi:peptidoglycan/xylan/chitin deacetylase (PgdA/CDA1 family)